MAVRLIRRLRELLDVNASSPSDGDVLAYDSGSERWVNSAAAGGGAPTTADYLVGTAQGDLSAEIVVGTAPGGELGGTWASPTVDATHSGSSHASVQSAAEATAAAALSSHAADTTGVHGIADTSALVLTGDSRLSDARTPSGSAGGVLGGTYPNPSFAADMATQAELDAVAAAKQNVDSDLTAIAAIAPANDDVIQRKAGAWTNRTMAQVIADLAALGTTFQPKDTTLDTYAGIDPSANVQAILSSADYAAIRSLLGLVIGTNVQAHDADLDTYAGITPSANVQSLLAASDYAAMRTLLGLVIGTNVQAYDADLTTWAGLTPSAFFQTLVDDSDAITARATLGVIASLFQSGGAQAIKLDDLAAPDDNTDLNASTSAHGLLKKLDNDTSHFLRGDGSWAAPGGGSAELLALKVYAPSAQTILSTTSNTLADIDATNAAVTFTAPASGNVLVRTNCWVDTGNDEAFMGIRESTTNLTSTITRVARAPGTQQYLSVPMYVSGISAGSHTYKLSFAANGGVTFRLIVQDGSATGKWGPLIIEVWAAP